ncbi:MAG: hypothetical protein EPN22_17135 [Nitrospirae bacterium]|nr:MAG: hypothetical protein EPN22_17135 [Nitrospirota bacterium]
MYHRGISKIDGSQQTELIKLPKSPGKLPDNPGSFNNILNESLNIIEAAKPEPRKEISNKLLSVPYPVMERADNARQDSSKFKEIFKVVMKHEGKAYVKEDGARGASKYGILETTARAYGYKGSIKNLTLTEAEGIYKKIWEKSGAASLPYPMSLVHFDSYVNSPNAAKKFLEKSEGDIDSYIKLREQRYKRLASVRPQLYAKYLKGWMNRINGLKGIVTDYDLAQNKQDASVPKTAAVVSGFTNITT